MSKDPYDIIGDILFLSVFILLLIALFLHKKSQKIIKHSIEENLIKQENAKLISNSINLHSLVKIKYQNANKKRKESLLTLGFTENSNPSVEEIKVAWRKVIKNIHPDATGYSDKKNLITKVKEARDYLMLDK